MIKIISDTSTLYSIEDGKKNNIHINPLSVTIKGNTYKEYEEITTDELIKIIEEGYLPVSSQPSIGRTMELYNELKGNKILNITMADGLSGTYSTACSAKEMVDNGHEIYVLNSKTLGAPQRHLVEKAVKLAERGMDIEEIIKVLEEDIKTSKSFLIPHDFNYLKRGGRLTTIAATIGAVLKLVPVITLTEDSTRLEKYALKRTINAGIDSIIEYFNEINIDDSYIVYICHGGNLSLAEKAKERISKTFSNIEINIDTLSPAFVTQGGPRCISIQIIKK